MNIADELRLHLFDMQLNATADRIDAEYQKVIRKLNDLADASMILPVDADGVPIHLGDDMESVNAPHMHGPVEYIALTESGWEVDGEPPKNLRHHATDTWERIIEDAIREGFDRTDVRTQTETNTGLEDFVARCKALAGGENL